MFTTRRTAAVVATALILSLSACGDDGSSLAPPVPIRVSQVAAGGALASGAAESDAMIDSRAMWWFAGFEYQVDPGLNALPSDATGYQFGPVTDVSESTVRKIASALGLTDAPVRNPNPQTYDQAWTVGPTDGSAASVVVVNDPQATWYYSGPWGVESHGGGTSVVEPAEPGATGSGDADQGTAPDETREWEPPTPPEGILTETEVRAEVTRILTAMGLNAGSFEFEVWADEWYASVTAWPELGGRRSPMSWNFGFGEMGRLQWASGILAEPVATGPFPLISLEEAIVRLTDQNAGWGAAISRPALDMDTPTSNDEASSDAGSSDAGSSDAGSSEAGSSENGEQMPEPVKETAVLVTVTADLWWAMDVDGSVWLLPAYRFTDTEGRDHIVAAVTDEYLMIEPQVGIIEPMPTPDDGGGIPGPGSEEEARIMEELVEWAKKELVGMELSAALEVAKTREVVLRVANRDGEEQMLTMDYVMNRINLATTTADGKGAEPEVITEILFAG
jgi:hypothetical protein